MSSLTKKIFNNAEASTKLLLLNAPSANLVYMKHLIDNGADINGQDKNGNTTLHIVSAIGNAQLVNYSLAIGANLTIKNNDNYTAFDLAKQNHHLDIIHSFRNASLGTLERSLLIYVSKNDISYVIKTLERGADINACNIEGVTSLHIAAVRGFSTIIDYLIQHGANLDAVDDNNVPATHYAMMLDDDEGYHRQSLFCLVSKGADPNLRNEEDFSLLYKASYKGYIETVGVILKQKVNVNEVFEICNCTALHGAVVNGHQRIALLLLANGADITIRNIYNKSAYDIAKENKLNHLAKILNLLDTKFISAAANGKIELVEKLLAKGADINAQGFYNENALDLATRHCHLNMISFLLARGVKIVNDIFGENAIHIAAKYCSPAVEFFVEKGADLEAKNWLGFSASDIFTNNQMLLGHND